MVEVLVGHRLLIGDFIGTLGTIDRTMRYNSFKINYTSNFTLLSQIVYDFNCVKLMMMAVHRKWQHQHIIGRLFRTVWSGCLYIYELFLANQVS